MRDGGGQRTLHAALQVRMTAVHFLLGLSWYVGVECLGVMSPEQLKRLCDKLYPNVR